jgi:hypothetical protein
MAAAGPIIAWSTYLFGLNAAGWGRALESALSTENEFRFFFILLAVGGVFSLVSAVVVAVQARRFLLRGVVIGGVVQTLAYAAVGAWFLSFVAASPLWWGPFAEASKAHFRAMAEGEYFDA